MHIYIYIYIFIFSRGMLARRCVGVWVRECVEMGVWMRWCVCAWGCLWVSICVCLSACFEWDVSVNFDNRTCTHAGRMPGSRQSPDLSDWIFDSYGLQIAKVERVRVRTREKASRKRESRWAEREWDWEWERECGKVLPLELSRLSGNWRNLGCRGTTLFNSCSFPTA